MRRINTARLSLYPERSRSDGGNDRRRMISGNAGNKAAFVAESPHLSDKCLLPVLGRLRGDRA
jgi:hypothetical protein